MITRVVLAQTAAPDQAAAPHFRSESGVVGSVDAGAVLLKLAIVLAIGVAAAWVANRKGWLERWKASSRVVGATRGVGSLAVVESLRVGPRTLVHRVRDGTRDYLLVESSSNIAISAIGPLPAEPVDVDL